MVTGTTPVFADISDRLADRLWVVIGLVVTLALLLLTLLLRAPVVALKAAVMNLLSVAAAFGVVTTILQSDAGARLIGCLHSGPLSGSPGSGPRPQSSASRPRPVPSGLMSRNRPAVIS
jgi:RND superfamily putative drug exporter